MVTLHGALCKSQATGAEDLLAGGVDDKACVKIIGQWHRAQKVLPERKAETAE
jgi:hypothetical protein